jgi:hypothetical protein
MNNMEPKIEKIVYVRRWCNECQKEYPLIFKYLKTNSGVKRSLNPRKNDECPEGHKSIIQHKDYPNGEIWYKP